MAVSFSNNQYKIGVLGGGQLGRMLLQEAANLDLEMCVLDPNPEAPCHKLANEFTCGDFSDYQTVMDFGRDKKIVTVEIEHVNVEALEELEKQGVKVYPQPRVLRIVQDKGLQKNFFREHNIPTAPYELVQDLEEVKAKSHLLPVMQKLRKGGYDGRGVQSVKSENDIHKGFDAPSVMEEWVDLDCEIAVIAGRNEQGEVKVFPAVELYFNPEANLVEYLFSPARISEEVEQKARKLAKKVIETFDMTGILAVEMFLTKSGELLVNEVAPRPHNSGHQSIEGNYTSQYGQHLRAILGLPLGDTGLRGAAVMVKLLGEKDQQGPVKYEGVNEVLSMPGVYPHLYGKRITKPFRKMGHVTVVAQNLEEAEERAKKVQGILKVMANK